MAPSPKDLPAGTWTSAITSIEPNRLLVRGYALDELMGRVSFGEAVYLVVTGELPSPSMRQLVDAVLVGYIDDGAAAPPALATRHAASAGAPIGNAVGAGVLAFGVHYGGGVGPARRLLDDGLEMAGLRLLFASAAADMAEYLVQRDRIPPPGFGHPLHLTDPRAVRLLQIANELEVEHVYSQYLRALAHALGRHPALVDERLPINIDGAIAAVTADLGFSMAAAEGLAVIARLPGLVAHAIEEQVRQTPLRDIAPSAHRYDGPSERRLRDRI
jgi:citrate synthase